MAGDYTRFTYKPSKRYSGVLMQQGRVQLDADWNEQSALTSERWRVQALDTFGPAAVSALSAEDAFEVEPLAGPPADLSLGAGRIYVDGLIAETFPSDTVTYSGQTSLFYPQPPPLPASGAALVYIDVWEREITYVQDADLLEIALGGPDTTTRTQTAWQVKFTTATSECDADLNKLFPPSAGRLTTEENAPPGSNDPCVLSPTGGYRGLENRLYRVEIHSGGGLGTAKFKWSRDNASIVSAVSAISVSGSQTVLSVSRIGRDNVLRFRKDDWVEVTDDHRELMGEPGEMARVLDTSEAALTITIDRAIPTGSGRAFATSKTEHAARHTRIIRWDQNASINALDADGLMTADSAQVQIEDGVFVTFSGGAMNSGDYWVFAARTADASVEKLDHAPPRGIIHHYAPLAVISIANGVVSRKHDCRTLWPPAGCCTVVVHPGEDIQTAIDSLPPAGGCVCLKTGLHEIEAPIRIRRSRILLHGESPGTIVRSDGATGMPGIPELLVTDLIVASEKGSVTDVVVEGIRFETSPALGHFKQPFTLVWLEDCEGVRIRACGIADLSMSMGLSTGIRAIGSRHIDVADTRIEYVGIGVSLFECAAPLSLSANAMVGMSLQPSNVGQPIQGPGLWGVWVGGNDASVAARIEGNEIEDFCTGVWLAPGAEGCDVCGNRIRRPAGAGEGSAPTSVDELRGYLGSRIYAVMVGAARCLVRGNYIDLQSPDWGGIEIVARHARVESNQIEVRSVPSLQWNDYLLPASIYCTFAKESSGHHALIRDNVLIGPQTGIVISRVQGVEVSRNHIDGNWFGWFGLRVDQSEATLLSGNEIRGVLVGCFLTQGRCNRVIDNDLRDLWSGMLFAAEADADVSGNGIAAAVFVGVWGIFKGMAVMSRNRLANCSFVGEAGFGLAVGCDNVDLLDPNSGVCIRIDSCEVIDTGILPDAGMVVSGPAIGIMVLAPECQLTGSRVAYTQPAALDAQKEHRALWLAGPLASTYRQGDRIIEFMFGSALIANNFLSGPGRTQLVELPHIEVSKGTQDLRFEKVTFSTNVCDHFNAAPSENEATVRLWGGHLIASGNHVKALDPKVHSMDLEMRNRVTLMGNITTGDYIGVTSAIKPWPIADFNVRI